MMKCICDVCGNASDSSRSLCPFCGSQMDVATVVKHQVFSHKTVNLEAGRPIVDVALHRMNEVIEDSLRNNISVLTLIHGYGSSGKGGAIRLECRKKLDFMKSKGVIADYIAGEDFNKRSGLVKSLIRRYPPLGTDRHLNKGNRGITVVILMIGLLVLPRLVLTATL